MSRKLRIFYVYSDWRMIDRSRGDLTNEFWFLRGLSEHHDVFYNGTPVDPTSDTIGDPERPIGVPSEPYDLYLTRASHELFLRLPSPKATMAYPYDADVFAAADSVLVTTHKWQELLQRHSQDPGAKAQLAKWYPDSFDPPRKITYIGQIPSGNFTVIPPEHPQVKRMRVAFTNGGFVMGYFGRIDERERLSVALEALQKGMLDGGDAIFVVGSKYRAPLAYTGPKMLRTQGYEAAQMPYVLNACDMLVSGEDPDNEWLGARKILEAISCRKPILTMPWSARVEQLGEDYPLYYKTPDDLVRLVTQFRSDPAFRQTVEQYLDSLAQHTNFSTLSDKLGQSISKLTPAP